jgi:hypothetical protein
MYSHARSLRAVGRHILFRTGLDGVRIRMNRLRGLQMGHLTTPGHGLAEVFSTIYRTGAWVEAADQDSLSGLGSTSAATRQLRGALAQTLRELDCRVLVDVGCGDFNWMREVEASWDYVGVDVVETVVARNAQLYGNARRRFVALDATREALPQGDVVLCREVLFHLSLASGLRVLRNIKASGARYLVATSDMDLWFNADIRDGDHRRLNLRMAPFRLPPPSRALADDSVSAGRVLGVWPCDQLP